MKEGEVLIRRSWVHLVRSIRCTLVLPLPVPVWLASLALPRSPSQTAAAVASVAYITKGFFVGIYKGPFGWWDSWHVAPFVMTLRNDQNGQCGDLKRHAVGLMNRQWRQRKKNKCNCVARPFDKESTSVGRLKWTMIENGQNMNFNLLLLSSLGKWIACWEVELHLVIDLTGTNCVFFACKFRHKFSYRCTSSLISVTQASNTSILRAWTIWYHAASSAWGSQLC